MTRQTPCQGVAALSGGPGPWAPRTPKVSKFFMVILQFNGEKYSKKTVKAYSSHSNMHDRVDGLFKVLCFNFVFLSAFQKLTPEVCF